MQRQAEYYWLKFGGLWTVGRRVPGQSGRMWEVVGKSMPVYGGKELWDVSAVGPKVPGPAAEADLPAISGYPEGQR